MEPFWGKDSEAVSYFDALMNNLTPVLNQESTGKTVAFFYVTAARGGECPQELGLYFQVHLPGRLHAHCLRRR